MRVLGYGCFPLSRAIMEAFGLVCWILIQGWKGGVVIELNWMDGLGINAGYGCDVHT